MKIEVEVSLNPQTAAFLTTLFKGLIAAPVATPAAVSTPQQDEEPEPPKKKRGRKPKQQVEEKTDLDKIRDFVLNASKENKMLINARLSAFLKDVGAERLSDLDDNQAKELLEDLTSNDFEDVDLD